MHTNIWLQLYRLIYYWQLIIIFLLSKWWKKIMVQNWVAICRLLLPGLRNLINSFISQFMNILKLELDWKYVDLLWIDLPIIEKMIFKRFGVDWILASPAVARVTQLIQSIIQSYSIDFSTIFVITNHFRTKFNVNSTVI